MKLPNVELVATIITAAIVAYLVSSVAVNLRARTP